MQAFLRAERFEPLKKFKTLFDPTRTAQAGLSWLAASLPPGNPDGPKPKYFK
jgi:hypothetical protein